ncbi:MAG: hypothetical protein RBU37_24490 [Myxococcota bacterium]|nr:hypothetical protein [Myxococcota bacterium]
MQWDVELDATHLDWLERWVRALAPRLAGSGLKIDVGEAPDPELIELCLQCGLPLETRHFEPEFWSTWEWERREPTRHESLERVCADPFFGPRLFSVLREALSSRAFQPKWLKTPIFEDVAREWVGYLHEAAEQGTIAAYDMLLPKLEKAVSATSLQHVEGLREAVLGMDLSTATLRTLQSGVMDEWCWPALEQANAKIGYDISQYDTDGPFPYLVLWDKESHAVVVVGPTGVLLEGRFEPPEGVNNMRSMRYVPGPEGQVGDVLFVFFHGSLVAAAWLSRPEQLLRGNYLTTWGQAIILSEGGISEGGACLRPGDTELAKYHSESYQLFSDGAGAWRCSKERLMAFDPRSGGAVSSPPPPFLSEVKGLIAAASSLMPLPSAITNSPLGQRDGLAGWRCYTDAEGVTHAEGIDGRAAPLAPYMLSARTVKTVGLFRFPERDGDYPVYSIQNELSLWSPGARFPVVPARHANWYQYWFGAPQWLPMHYWHLLQPAQPEASRAMRDATAEQARALFAAAQGCLQEDAAAQVQAGSTVAVLLPGHRRTNATPGLPRIIDAIREQLPQVRAPRLVIGLARVIALAGELEGRLRTLQELALQAKPPVLEDGRRDYAFKAISALFGHGPGWCDARFEEQFRAVDLGLSEAAGAGTEQAGADAAEGALRALSLPESGLPWLVALAQSRSLLYRLLAPGTPADERHQLRAFLALVQASRFAAEPSRYRLMRIRCADWLAPGMRHDNGQRLLSSSDGEHRYFVTTRHFDGLKKHYEFEVLERASEREGFAEPPGTEAVLWTVELAERVPDAERIAAALALLDERGPFAVAPAAARHVSEQTGLLYPSASLLLAAAWQPWECAADLRKALGLKQAEASLGREELNLSWHEPYHRVMAAHGPAELYSMENSDGTASKVAQSMARAVLDTVGPRTPLPAELVLRLREELRGQRPYHLDVRVLAEPERFDFLTKDERWVIRPWTAFKNNISYMRGWLPPGWPKHVGMPEGDCHPDVEHAFSGWVLRHFLVYLAWAQLELPRQHPLRLGAHRMVELIDERLKNPDLLLLAGAVDLSLEEDPSRLAAAFAELRGRFDGPRYRALDEGEGASSAEGLDRGDLVLTWPRDLQNSFFFAFRPASLRNPELLLQLARELGFGDVFQPRRSGCTCGLNFGQHTVVDFTDLSSFVTWSQPSFQALCAQLGAAGSGYDAQPRLSAPEALNRVAEQYGLAEDPAVLLLQLRALPEPTRERVMRYNDWDRRRYQAAAQALLKAGLAVEAQVERSKRTLFAVGSDGRLELQPLQAPATSLERAKLELHGLAEDHKGRLRAPFGVVLPLRPLSELYDVVSRAAAS